MSSNEEGETRPTRAKVDGEDASLSLGGRGVPGDADVRDEEGRSRVELEGETGSIAFKDTEGTTTVEHRGDRGAVMVGGDSAFGRILLRDGEANVAGELRAQDGELTIHSADGTPALTIAPDGTITTAKPIRPGGGHGDGDGSGEGNGPGGQGGD